MSDSAIKVIIPFRDRGLDPRRAANLSVVLDWWASYGYAPTVVSDGLEGDVQFNRHRAYNRAVEMFPSSLVFVFTEADMLIPIPQVTRACEKAVDQPGLVVPFTQYRYLSDEATATLRDNWSWATSQAAFSLEPKATMENGKSIGAVNVVSRSTIEQTGGFTEATSGNWYDDNIIEEGFAALTYPTRWVQGPAVHLYHLPGWQGTHLSDADKQATERNRNLLLKMRADIRRGDMYAVRELLAHREGSDA